MQEKLINGNMSYVFSTGSKRETTTARLHAGISTFYRISKSLEIQNRILPLSLFHKKLLHNRSILFLNFYHLNNDEGKYSFSIKII